MSNNQELPKGWEWQGGESSDSYYTKWFATEYKMGGPYAGEYGMGGMCGEVYWDEGGKHIVDIRPVESCIGRNGENPVMGYSILTESFDTEEEAIEAVPKLIEEL